MNDGSKTIAGYTVLALHDVRDLKDDRLRYEGNDLAVFGALDQCLRCGVLPSVAVDEERHEHIGIDRDTPHVRCALASCAQPLQPSPGPVRRV